MVDNQDAEERMTEPLLSDHQRRSRRQLSNVDTPSATTATAEDTRVFFINDPVLNQEFKFCNNSITTAKYRYYNFIFKNVFEQLMRAANAYFLFISVLQLIPGLSPTGRFTTLLPLCLVMSVTAAKDCYEDWKRHLSDGRVNNSRSHVLRGVDFVPCHWSDISVGDVVRVYDGETFPADIALLSSSEPLGLCYVETSSLDGETNLKLRRSRPETYESVRRQDDAWGTVQGRVECELPNKRLHTFQGNVFFNENKIPLDVDNLLLRGATLRNTKHVTGVVVFTGHDTKLMQNSAGAKFKQSQVEKMTNKQIAFIFMFQLFICVVSALGNTIWTGVQYNDSWYLTNRSKNPLWNGFKSFFTFIILYNNLIPISLYVSMEMAKIIQAFLINNDLELYYPENDTPAAAKTSSLNEELGQVQYVFSDKTGTLTCNKMEFFKFCVDGTRYGVGTTEIGRAAALREGREIEEELPPPYYDPSKFKFYDSRILNGAWKQQQNAENIKEFFTVLSVCHTVIPERENTDDPHSPIVYQAASPDEGALVQAAEKFGFIFKHRTLNEMQISIDGQDHTFEILAVLEFTSARKRMSIVVRNESNRIMVYSKGADNVIFERLRQDQPNAGTTLQHLEDFATEGLRTLVCARRELSDSEYAAWSVRYKEAATAVVEREERLAEVAEEIECDLELVGATAIEDQLQDGVPDTIAELANAGIKVWMLTGDKQETAINIGFACSLIDESLGIVEIEASTSEEMQKELPQKLQMVQESLAERQDVALVIDGKKLDLIFPSEDDAQEKDHNKMFFKPPTVDDPLVAAFFDMSILCRAVICCRVSPSQKAQIVRLVKDRLHTVTLSIGDGANDVSMILEAHVGVGINGEEGLQAARSADYAIAQFRFLKRLLLVHGRWSYRRISKLILYSFYKNIVLYLTQFWFVFFNGFSGTSIYDKWTIAMFNVVFTSVPILGLAVFDRDLSAARAIDFPELYVQGQKNRFFNTRVFWAYIANAIWHSMVCFFVPYFALSNSMFGSRGLDMIDVGIAMYTAVVIVVNLKVAIETSTFTWISVLMIGGSILSWFLFVLVYGALFSFLKFDDFAAMYFRFSNFGFGLFWFTVILTVVIALSRDLGWKYYLRSTSRQLYYVVQEADATGAQVEKSMLLKNYPMEEGVDIQMRKKKASLATRLPSGLERTARRIFKQFKYHGFAFSQSRGQASFLEARLHE